MESKFLSVRGVDLEIFKDGRVLLCAYETQFTRNGKTCTWSAPSQFLSPQMGDHGYWMIVKQFNHRPRVRFLLHRLIAMAWVDGFSPDLTVNHKDGNKLNNDPLNLEWITKADNTRHQWRTGLEKRSRAKLPSGAKLTQEQVDKIMLRRRDGERVSDLAKEFGICDSLVYRWIRKARALSAETAV